MRKEMTSAVHHMFSQKTNYKIHQSQWVFFFVKTVGLINSWKLRIRLVRKKWGEQLTKWDRKHAKTTTLKGEIKQTKFYTDNTYTKLNQNAELNTKTRKITVG